MLQTTSRAIFHSSYLTSAFKPRFLQNCDALRSPELPPLSIHILADMISFYFIGGLHLTKGVCIAQFIGFCRRFFLLPLVYILAPEHSFFKPQFFIKIWVSFHATGRNPGISAVNR